MERLIAGVMAIICCFQIANYSDFIDKDIIEISKQIQNELTEASASKTETEIVMNEENVRLCGRTKLIDNVLWCAYSGTGAAFNYTGKGFDLKIKGDSSVGCPDDEARVAIYVNGKRAADFMVDESEVTVRIAESKTNVTSEVKIIKLSEGSVSTMGIEPITIASGEAVEPVREKDLKIEFIGDSITCGYGVDDEVKEHGFSTTAEDVTKTYGYKTAELLNAESSFVSLSGWGVISGATGDSSIKNDTCQLPLYYEKLGFSYRKMNNEIAPQDLDWDFDRYTPDIIVINLGTNDNTYCNNDVFKCAEFRKGYKDFLKVIRKNNPNAEIFCVLGIVGANLYSDISKAALEYSKENSDDKIHAVKLPIQTASMGYAAGWHPTEKAHEMAANYLAREIKITLGL